jgi:hypothetical protein
MLAAIRSIVVEANRIANSSNADVASARGAHVILTKAKPMQEALAHEVENDDPYAQLRTPRL